ncbi:DUF397 domain-containing protein [Streptomyces sp. NPDC090442]|uniref:DUF397 domain-containing protein n=1 Tax=Streptomyces sp. NPDC090442 TaxID=3365962 RepID=UPI003813F7AE
MPHHDWFVSSYCNEEESACVEVRVNMPRVDVRDSTDPAGPVHTFGPAAWSAFLAGVKTGDL